MHRAAVWKDMMFIHGGIFQTILGDVWALNMSRAALKPVETSLLDGSSSLLKATTFLVMMALLLLLFFILFVATMYRKYSQAAYNHEDDEDEASKGLPKSAINKFPLVPYSKKDQAENEEDLCPICLVSFQAPRRPPTDSFLTCILLIL